MFENFLYNYVLNAAMSNTYDPEQIIGEGIRVYTELQEAVMAYEADEEVMQ